MRSLLHICAVLCLGALGACTHLQPANVGSQRFGLVIGNDDRQLVDKPWLDGHPKFAPLVDAIGLIGPEGGNCTVTYVGGGMAITAGHCFNAGASEARNRPCPNMPIQWEYRVDSPPYIVSQCRRILAARNSPPYDYAIIEVDPLPRAEVRAVHNAGTSSGVTSPGIMLGHPGGRPLIYSGSCYLPPYASGIAHDCDSEPGSSGSIMLEQGSLRAVGIHYGYTAALNAALYLGHTPLGDLMDDRFKPKGRFASLDGKCLDVRGGDSANRTPVQLWSCASGDAQTWTLTPYQAIVGLEGKCLDIPYPTPGTTAWLFACHYGTNQNWRMPEMELRAGIIYCLDVPGIDPANFTRAQIWKCHGGDGQKWTWTAKHELKNEQGRCLDATNYNPTDGTTVVVHDCHGGANQIWDIAAGGAVRGISGLCLDISGGALANGTPLQLHECNGSAAQIFFPHGPIKTADGKCLAPSTDHPANGMQLVVQDCTGGARQQWDYYP